ncbi:MAG: hypothetical protein V4685_16795, partial [Bacteroidota bacterium]
MKDKIPVLETAITPNSFLPAGVPTPVSSNIKILILNPAYKRTCRPGGIFILYSEFKKPFHETPDEEKYLL